MRTCSLQIVGMMIASVDDEQVLEAAGDEQLAFRYDIQLAAVTDGGDGRIGLFSGASERMNLWLAPLLVSLILAEVLFQGGFFWLRRWDWGMFICNIVFFNAIHTVFNIVMAAGLPEFRDWINRSTQGQPHRFWARLGATFAVLYGLLFFGGALIWPVGGDFRRTAFSFFIVAYLIFHSHHMLTQTRGLSLVYHQRIRSAFDLTPGELARMGSVERYERYFFAALLAVYVGIRIFYDPMFVKGTWPAISGARSVIHLGWLQMGLFVLAGLLVLLIVANGWRIPRAELTNKSRFLFRLMVFPLGAFSLTALFAARILHGMEYLFVCQKMTLSSSAGAPARHRVLSLLFIAGLGVALLDFYHPFIGKRRDPSAVIVAFFSFVVAIEILHIHIDGLIFRMRDRITREALGGLL